MDQFDLIVIGGGLAGLCAAVEAGECGARVLLLEKEDDIGGSSVLSGRYMAFAKTPMQAAQGIDDSADKLVEDMLDVGGGVNDRKLVEAYGNLQLDTYNWLVDHGVKFQSIQAVSGHSVPRGHTIDSHQAIQALYKRVKELSNVDVKLAAPAARLLSDASGRINQVVYQEERKHVYVAAVNGIILTSGGFSQSEDMLGHFAPNLKRTIRIGGRGNTGDGLKMAWEHGAWVQDLPYLSGTYGFHPTADGPVKSQGLAFYKGGIIINQKGKRFVNESLSYKLLGHAALKQPEDKTYQIWDQSVMDASIPGDKLYDFDNLFKLGLVYKAETLEALAEQIHISPQTLKNTIATYNQDIQDGTDEFKRDTLTHRYGKPIPIKEAPFYAFETKVAMLATYAGLAVNDAAEVVNSFDEVIPGLYAAGEIAGGFHGAGYMTGSSLGKAAIFGRVSAQTALAKSSVAGI